MAQRSKKLFAPVVLTNGYVTEYTTSNVRCKNIWLTATNPDTASHTVTVALVPSGGAAGDTTNAVVFKRTILPGQTVIFYETVGHLLENGDFIAAKADVGAQVILMGSGDEVSL